MAAEIDYDTGTRRRASHDEHGDYYTDGMADGFGDNAARPGPSSGAYYEEDTEMTGTITSHTQTNAGLEPPDSTYDVQDNNYTHDSSWGGHGSVSAMDEQSPQAIPSYYGQTYGYNDGRGHQQPRRRHQERRRPQRRHGSRTKGSSHNPRNDLSYGTRPADAYGNPHFYDEQAMIPFESSQSWGQMLPGYPDGQGGPSNNTFQAEGYGQEVADEVLDELAEQQLTASYDYAGPDYGPGPALAENIPQPMQYSSRGYQSNKSKQIYDIARNMSVEHSNEFRPGRVLMVDWAEPKGHLTGTSVCSGRSENVFQKNRRFIIMTTFKGHSDCLSISTYGGRGCTKPGSHNEVHGIIYSQGKHPQLLKNEGILGFDHVCMIPDNAMEQLHEASRVDYSRVYPINHNYAVSFIGRISDSDLIKVREAVSVIRQEALAAEGQFQYV